MRKAWRKTGVLAAAMVIASGPAWAGGGGADDGPGIGRRVGDQVDSVIAATRDGAGRAWSWTVATASEAKARAAARWERAKAAAPEPSRGVHLYVGGAAPWRALAPGEAAGPRLVVLIHGLDEAGGVWDELAPRLAEAGLAVARFDYPNDQGLDLTARELTDALAGLRAGGVEAVSLVGHSMGGVVARDMLTRPDGYAGAAGRERLPRVGRLIMTGAPNAGSYLAYVQCVGEAREQVARWWAMGWDHPEALLAGLKDGDGQAGVDLRPGSAYLADLNARPLPADVRLTVIVGSLGGTTAERLDAILAGRVVPLVLGDEWTRELRTLAKEAALVLGDGIVTDASQRLPGVTDTVLVPGNHRTMISRLEVQEDLLRALGCEVGPPAAVPVIVERLAPTGDAGAGR